MTWRLRAWQEALVSVEGSELEVRLGGDQNPTHLEGVVPLEDKAAEDSDGMVEVEADEGIPVNEEVF